ncbi:MAG TPA: T9SS type A sorting domain-containing protein [Saprospiraceae bacterium]|nr:T9SS type A sorting domain-containing protein [Saprospiraceae bacterium]
MNQRNFLFSLLFLTWSSVLVSQTLIPDPAFGVNGKINFQVSLGQSITWCTALQPDGKILAGGYYVPPQGGVRACVVRHNSDGALDTTFGNGGEWISNDLQFGLVSKIIVQPDGKILVTGRSKGACKIFRLKANGTTDFSFGSFGAASVPVWTGTDTRTTLDMNLQPDGKILFSCWMFFNGTERAMGRLNSNGSLDQTFGASGIVKLPVSEFGGANFGNDFVLNINAENQILAAISIEVDASNRHLSIVQFDEDGNRLGSFGENGMVIIPTASEVTDIIPLPGNDFFVATQINLWDENAIEVSIFKYHPNGEADETYGVQGRGVMFVIRPNTMSSIRRAVLQPDGKIVVFGGNFQGTGFIGRYDAQGFPDQGFGPAGLYFPEDPTALFFDGLVQPDGKIGAMGYYTSPDMIQGSFYRFLAPSSSGTADAGQVIKALNVYPNPINGRLFSFAYELPFATQIELELIDSQGRSIGVLLNAERAVGKNEESLVLPANVGQGIYFLKMKTNKGNTMIKLFVLS